MKKHRLIRMISLLVVSVVVLGAAIGGSVYSKYLRSIESDRNVIAETFHLWAPQLSSESTPETTNVYSSSADIVLANGTDALNCSSIDIDYSVSRYYGVYDSVADSWTWTPISSAVSYSFPSTAGFDTETISVTPYTDSHSVTYYDIKVVVTCTSFTKVMTGIYHFDTTPFSVSYTFDPTSVDHLEMHIETNSRGGEYDISWLAGIIPDNSDVNGILTGASVGPSSVEDVSMTSYTTYDLVFFVSPAVRSAILNATDKEAQVRSYFTVSPSED